MAPHNTWKHFGFTGLAAIIVGRFSPSLNSPCRLTDKNGLRRGNAWLGTYGERVAAAYLRSQGVSILRRNFRAPRGGEVDVIARSGKLLLFIEVKTRHHDSPIRPLDAVDKQKQILIERGANAWLRKLRTRQLPWRFDVIEILVEEGEKPVVRWIRDAF